MKVKELIEKLSHFDPDSDVFVNDDNYNKEDNNEIKSVEKLNFDEEETDNFNCYLIMDI